MKIKKDVYDRIAEVICSETSPVGINAEKTHVIIIKLLEDIDKRLSRLEESIKIQKL